MTVTSTLAAPALAHKIRPRHLDRLAIVYVRRSTPHQGATNRESTDLPYQLRRRAAGMGWAEDRVVVIDDDQGISGQAVANRPGFQRLLAKAVLSSPAIKLLAVRPPSERAEGPRQDAGSA